MQKIQFGLFTFNWKKPLKTFDTILQTFLYKCCNLKKEWGLFKHFITIINRLSKKKMFKTFITPYLIYMYTYVNKKSAKINIFLTSLLQFSPFFTYIPDDDN